LNVAAPTDSATIASIVTRARATDIFADLLIFLQNVQEHATPLAGASVEHGVEVHVTGEVENRAASGGCCDSACSASLFFWKAFAMFGELLNQ
jgi:hypothetical protein